MAFLKILLMFLVLLVVAGAGFGYWVWADIHTPRSHGLQTSFEIARGASLDETIHRLSDAGIIESPLPIKIYIKLTPRKPVIKAGKYMLPSPISPLGALEKLEEGGNFTRFTIIEGWTRWDIARALAQVPSFRLNESQALSLLNDPTLIKDLDPRATNLEGYLFPDTYFLAPEAPAKQVVADAVKRFRQVWSEKLASRAPASGRSLHSLVTIASIIETEAKLKEERPIIASVVENRLARRMPLSMDSTIVYASKLAGAWKNNGIVYLSDVNRKSPYNTRIYAGLPPGPVGSPGLNSLEAAVSPARTDYLFYVRNPARNDGAHNFYNNAASFEVGVQALRNWEATHR